MHPGPRSQSPGQKALHELYVVEQQSYADIARRYGVTKTTIKRWLRAAGISARSISEATSLAQTGRPLSEAHRAALAMNAAKARAALTEESFKKISASKKGRPAANKGRPWTDAERATHMAYRQTPQYREKIAATKRGEKGPNWRGGVTPTDPRLTTWQWRELRRQVYERDEWTCRDCGVHCHNKIRSRGSRGQRIQAHHIVSRRDGGKDEIDNLMTLCMSCHMKREWRDNRRKEH